MRKWLMTLLIGLTSTVAFAGCSMGMTNNSQSEPAPENKYEGVESVEELVDALFEELEYEISYSDLMDAIDENGSVEVSEFAELLGSEYGVDLGALFEALQADDVIEVLNEMEDGLGDTIQDIDIESLLDEYAEETVETLMEDVFGNDEDDGEEEEDGYVTVKFELCTDLETNKIRDQEIEVGGTVQKPSVALIDKTVNMEIEGWYTDPDYAEDAKWSFLMDVVEEDMTLYARWVTKYSVSYYLGSEEAPMYTESVIAGTMYEVNSDWADGYKCNGFFFDRIWNNVTGKYDFEEKIDGAFEIDGDVKIYIDRSEELYFDAEMIAGRFKPVAANGGRDGATVGSIEYVEDNDGGYAKVNFGYSPTITDSHILLSGVTVDVTKSQKLQITLKNVGKAETLRFYFISWVDAENKIYANNMAGMNEACTSRAYRYDTETEMNMTEDSEWMTITFDIAKESIYNGVSLWGTSEILLSLRVQSGYRSDPENPNDLSNELWIKSIEGIADDTYTSSDDTAEVKELLSNDTDEALIAASEAQESVDGFVFPKDRACVEAAEGTSIYHKTNGLLFYGAYLQEEAKFTIRAAEGQTIDLNELTTLTLRLRNYGYATSFDLKYYNKDGRSSVRTVVVDTTMGESKDYVLNMFQAEQYKGELDKLEITYKSVGNDNAILFESITFSPFKASQIVGFNFVDRNTFGLTSNEMYEVQFAGEGLQSGTEFNVLQTGAWFEKEYTQFALHAYKDVSLFYKMDNEGVTAVKLYLTVGGAETEYKFDTVVSNTVNEIKLPLTQVGNMTKMRVVFEGTGTICFREIKFSILDTAVDYSTSEVESLAGGNKVLWMNTTNYNPDMAAMQYTYAPIYNEDGTVKNHNSMSFYIGYSSYKNVGNISLEGKSKIVIIYQNRTEGNEMTVALGLTDKNNPEWKTAISEPYAQGSTGGYSCKGFKTNMTENEWAVYEIDLFDMKNITAETVDEKVVACILLSPFMDMYIRAIAFI